MFVVNTIRVVILIISIASIVIMLRSFIRERENWNQKTRDYWFSRVMWMVFAVSAMIEGIIRHTPFRYSFILLIAAVLTTFKGNLIKGKWGGDRE